VDAPPEDANHASEGIPVRSSTAAILFSGCIYSAHVLLSDCHDEAALCLGLQGGEQSALVNLKNSVQHEKSHVLGFKL